MHYKIGFFSWFVSGLILSSFSFKGEDGRGLRTPPERLVKNFDPQLVKVNEVWSYQGKVFSGYLIEEEKDHCIVYKLPIVDGKQSGWAYGWYNSGEKLLERNFIDGKKEGEFRQWWPNGNFRYLYQYKNDQLHGLQIVYFPNGKKRQVSHYFQGREEGLQSTWNEEGILISNYTIKSEKLYGVISVKSCILGGHK
jgi:antitoxin component YwqK of YwqJK toxin-antitoxin module